MTESEKLLFRAMIALHEEIELVLIAKVVSSDEKEELSNSLHKHFYKTIFECDENEKLLEETMTIADNYIKEKETS